MSQSVRFTLRRGQQLNLSVEEVAKIDCRLQIDAQSGGDDKIVVGVSVEGRGEASNAQGEIDNAVHRAAAGENIGEGDRYIVGIGNQTPLNLSDLLAHQASLQTQQYFQGETATENMRRLKAESKRKRKARAA